MPGQPFVFVHLPKTAGTSLNTLLRSTFRPGSVSPSLSTVLLTARDAAALSQFELITGHLSGADLDRFFPNYAGFTFLRDPVDRCLSLYSFLRNHESHPLIPLDRLTGRNEFVETTSLARQLDPADFFRCEHPGVRQAVRNRMCWQLGDHARPECRRFSTEHEAFDHACLAVDRFFFVGIAERMEKDAAELLQALGFVGTSPMPRENVTTARLRRGDLSPAALDAIDANTQFDRRLYDYALRRNETGGNLRDVA